MIHIEQIKLAKAHACPPCDQSRVTDAVLSAVLSAMAHAPTSHACKPCNFGNGKDKHLVITCHHFDELGQAIKYAQSIASNESVSVAIKTITQKSSI